MYLRVSVKSNFAVSLKFVRQSSAQENFSFFLTLLSPGMYFATYDTQKLGLNILKLLMSNIAAQNQGVLSASRPITRWVLLGVAIVRLFLWSITWKWAIAADTKWPTARQSVVFFKMFVWTVLLKHRWGFYLISSTAAPFITGFSASLNFFELLVLQKPASVVLHSLKEQIWSREWAIS